ncbi:uncharacterized protein B0J16DRAFT_375028 [Fusarium flagelliforme]|uniref:uncharacterized protein n=1 Tax=Fusarium flagelliforme TaxID=2675880 RepID=UPI001E8DED23|nr:uncharacterized protein B0J16DRAFT_375028 [Fusarium flagelliforme]KAH7180105.1 hypothetical protein B0J16DRAFT_375028 [Fusarium flagelliforme]
MFAMLKRLGFRAILIPAALITQLLLLVGVGILLRAGTGSLDNPDHLPVTPDLYLVLIDTKQYTRKVGKETYKGLPDSHDFSKEKDFFALFPALYCSGKRNGERYEADYCSAWGKQLFDLHRLWRVWGVDLIKDNLIGSTPRFVYAGLLTTAVTVGLSAICGILAVCSYWS